MNLKKISVLGCGWLGQPLAVELIKSGYQINGSTTREDNLISLSKVGIQSYLINITDQSIKGKIELFLESDLLIFNIPPVRRPDILDFYPKLIGLLLPHIEKSSIKKVLFISSTSVYQNINGTVDETTIPEPEKDSGMAILKAESMLQNCDKFKTTILRFAGLAGPDRHPGRFLAGKTGLSGALNPVNLIHLDDCIGIIISIVKNEKWGKIYNGCYPNHPTKMEFYTHAATQLGLTPPDFSLDKRSDFKVVNGQKVERELNYQYKKDIFKLS